jgi:hypothetical protein
MYVHSVPVISFESDPLINHGHTSVHGVTPDLPSRRSALDSPSIVAVDGLPMLFEFVRDWVIQG